ncbi:MAG: toxin Bro [Clostridia bacterium]|nr:toxin Bro [Clostridia bacterium]
MNNVAIFSNSRFGDIRTIDEQGKVYFCGKDIATALGYTNTKDAVSRHCVPKGVVKHDLLTNGGKQRVNFIDEGNLYRLITHSKLPDAEKFESWVFDEVLPTIRKTGTYTVTNAADDYKARTLAVKEQNAKIRTAQLMFKIAEKTNTKYREVLQSRITQLLTGEYLLPLPEVEARTLSATEIGERLGISAHKVGMLANAHNLKTEKYGKWFYDKAKTADKQVETFRYFERAVEVFKSLLEVAV